MCVRVCACVHVCVCVRSRQSVRIYMFPCILCIHVHTVQTRAYFADTCMMCIHVHIFQMSADRPSEVYAAAVSELSNTDTNTQMKVGSVKVGIFVFGLARAPPRPLWNFLYTPPSS